MAAANVSENALSGTKLLRLFVNDERICLVNMVKSVYMYKFDRERATVNIRSHPLTPYITDLLVSFQLKGTSIVITNWRWVLSTIGQPYDVINIQNRCAV